MNFTDFRNTAIKTVAACVEGYNDGLNMSSIELMQTEVYAYLPKVSEKNPNMVEALHITKLPATCKGLPVFYVETYEGYLNSELAECERNLYEYFMVEIFEEGNTYP